MELLESVPNVSVARDEETLGLLLDAVERGIRTGGHLDGSRALLADVHLDADHDRSVLTIIGRGEAFACGLEALARACVAHLDVTTGFGVHPRIGALDVLPVVALQDTPAARRSAHQLVERIAAVLGDELHVPVIRYALDHDGTRIAGAACTGDVRRGGPSRAAQRVSSGELRRIAGPARPHPTAGCTIAGVRPILIAFNVVLDTDDMGSASSIARQVRAVTDGPHSLPGVRALGFRLASRELVQVSTNIEQHDLAAPANVLDVVHRLAAADGIDVIEAELVGLAPDDVLAQLVARCADLGVTLRAAADPSLDAAMRRA